MSSLRRVPDRHGGLPGGGRDGVVDEGDGLGADVGEAEAAAHEGEVVRHHVHGHDAAAEAGHGQGVHADVAAGVWLHVT